MFRENTVKTTIANHNIAQKMSAPPLVSLYMCRTNLHLWWVKNERVHNISKPRPSTNWPCDDASSFSACISNLVRGTGKSRLPVFLSGGENKWESKKWRSWEWMTRHSCLFKCSRNGMIEELGWWRIKALCLFIDLVLNWVF